MSVTFAAGFPIDSQKINLVFYQPKLICIEILENKEKNKIFKYLEENNYSFCKKLRVSYFFKLNSFNG